MQDGIIKGTGNSRFLKSVPDFLSQYPTYESFVAALVAGTLPVDFNGINETGWQQLGTALNMGNLLSDETAAMLGLPKTATPDDAFRMVPGVGDIVSWSKDIGFWEDLGLRIFPCDGQILPAADYPEYFKTQGPITGYTWTKVDAVGFFESLTMVTMLHSGRLLAVGRTGTVSAIKKSDDNGKTWITVLSVEQSTADTMIHWVLQKKDGIIIANTHSRLYTSIDNGETWTSETIPTAYIRHPVEVQNGRLVGFGGNSSNILSTSDDNGRTWVNTRNSFGGYARRAVSAKNGDLYIITFPGSGDTVNNQVFVSEDNGETASPVYSVSEKMPFFGWGVLNNGVAVFSANHGILCQGKSYFELYKDGLSRYPANLLSEECNSIQTDRDTIHAMGFFQINMDGNWIQGIKSGQPCTYLSLKNSELLCFGMIDDTIYSSKPDSSIIILPNKPGHFIRVK